MPYFSFDAVFFRHAFSPCLKLPALRHFERRSSFAR